MNPLITVCAKANSEGLPGKNIRLLNGKPLIVWTVEQAKRWNRGEIVISTDSIDIANWDLGVEKIYYPNERAKELGIHQDDTPKVRVVREVLKYMESIAYVLFDPIIDLDVTNPCRTVGDIGNAYNLWLKTKPSTLFSVTPARKNPYFNQVEYLNSDCLGTAKQGRYFRRQDAPLIWDMNCSIYIYSRGFLLMGDDRVIQPDSVLYEMEPWQAYDIDNEIDFQIVECLTEKRGKCLGLTARQP